MISIKGTSKIQHFGTCRTGGFIGTGIIYKGNLHYFSR